ncbi:MAG: hypothetical protein E6995_13225 [Enterobacteriaceae bacterium]|nr:hypothetical protein [Hafnia paralvei]MDU1193097.1 hypothetical protein [Enterobacteriaceae bacterium]MDU1245187.1 hypothetical protein [Enterobacteriaceae bacterium]
MTISTVLLAQVHQLHAALAYQFQKCLLAKNQRDQPFHRSASHMM